MYQVGAQVVYGVHGVCNVVDLEERVVDRKRVSYLVLEPIGQGGSRYLVPTHNATAMAKIKNILTREELETLLESENVMKDGWIRDETQRKQTYRELIGSGDRARLLQMIRSIYNYRKLQSASGKKIHLCDDNFLRDAEKLLAGEFAIVLNIEQEQARQYIRSKLKEDA